MAESGEQKVCAILLGMGGPDSLDDVRRFLINIFSDRMIIRLPGGPLLQKPLAHLITLMRLKKVRTSYAAIGGASPLLQWTRSQAQNIEDTLAPIIPGFKVFIGMRYFTPTIDDAVKQANEQGFERIVFLSMNPQYCTATTGSYYTEAKKNVAKYENLEAEYIDNFHDWPEYIDLFKEYIQNNITDDDVLLYTAHSIPQSLVDEDDPYVEQVKKTAELAADGHPYYLSFQSRTGPVTWVGPDTKDEARRIALEKSRPFLVPISFLCDHIETLHELDIALTEMIKNETGIKISRMPMFNDDPRLGQGLANLIMKTIGHDAG